MAGSWQGHGRGAAWYVLIRHCCFSTATMVARFTLNVTLSTQFVLFLHVAVVYKRPEHNEWLIAPIFTRYHSQQPCDVTRVVSPYCWMCQGPKPRGLFASKLRHSLRILILRCSITLSAITSNQRKCEGLYTSIQGYYKRNRHFQCIETKLLKIWPKYLRGFVLHIFKFIWRSYKCPMCEPFVTRQISIRQSNSVQTDLRISCQQLHQLLWCVVSVV
jgi:hypothetical protein